MTLGTNRSAKLPSDPYAPERAPALLTSGGQIDAENARETLPSTARRNRTPCRPDSQEPGGRRPIAGSSHAAGIPRHRRRASAARLLRVRLTPRDVAMLRDVVRFGALTIEQLGRRHFGSVLTAYGRLAALADAGYLELVRVWYAAPGVYVATPEGTRVADVPLPPARVSPATLEHHLAVADVADWLLARDPGAQWITERELRRDAMVVARERGTGRLLDGVAHVPDGVLLPADGTRQAIEVERTGKGSARYRRVLGWYAGSMDFDRVRWLVTDEGVRSRLAALVRAERLDDLVDVEPLPPNLQDMTKACSVERRARGCS